jgi:hypothetical protein
MEILRLKMKGFKNKEIAALVNRTEISVAQIVNDPLARVELAKMHKQRGQMVMEAIDELDSLTPHAVNVYREVLDSEEAYTNQKLKVAGEVLDRAGAGKTQRIETRSVSYQLSGTEVQEIRNRAMEKKRLLAQGEMEVVNE